MNLRLANFLLLISFLLMLPGCELIEGVFKAGIWLTLFLIVLVIAILVLIFSSVMHKPEKGSNFFRDKSTDPG